MGNIFKPNDHMESTLIKIKVKPGQSRFKVTVKEGQVTADLKEQPENNKANIELIRMLTKILKNPVYLISGHKSKTKQVKIENMTEPEVLTALTAIKN